MEELRSVFQDECGACKYSDIAMERLNERNPGLCYKTDVIRSESVRFHLCCKIYAPIAV